MGEIRLELARASSDRNSCSRVSRIHSSRGVAFLGSMATPAPKPIIPAAPMCAPAVSSLVKVLITGTVASSTMSPGIVNATAGDPVKISFYALPTAMFRMAEGFVVKDGIAPYQICEEDFIFKIGNNPARLGQPPKTYEGDRGAFYFSLEQSRPVNDGAWISQNAVDGKAGFPVVFHGRTEDNGQDRFGLLFNLDFKVRAHYRFGCSRIPIRRCAPPHPASRTPAADVALLVWLASRHAQRNTVKSLELTDKVVYTPKSGLLKSAFTMYNGWLPNTVLEIDWKELKIGA